jgi:hypothetical protein
LIQAAELLKTVDANSAFELNDLLELRNIQLYFEHEMFLPGWDEKTVATFKQTLETLDPKIKQYFLSIEEAIFARDLPSIEFRYRKAFWSLFNNLQAYKRISLVAFADSLKANPHHIRYILSHKKLVEHFNVQLRDFLFADAESAEILLSAIEEAERFGKNDLHFPKALTLADRQDIIARYIVTPEPNLNFIELIEHSRNSDQLRLTDRIRLDAKNKAKQINESILNSSGAGKFGIAISFDKDQAEPKKILSEGIDNTFSYSRSYLDAQATDLDLFDCFTVLFEYTNLQQLINLVSKRSELMVIERIGMASKNAYQGGYTFLYKARIALMQMHIFEAYLKHRGTSLEKLFDAVIRQRLQKKIGLENIRFTLPDESAPHLTKIRLMAPELEFLCKQYDCFVREGKIDFELLQFSSAQLNYAEIGSAAEKKYIYAKENETARLRHLFFSDQGPLFYVKTFEERYGNFYDLIANEKVSLHLFENYQRYHIDELIAEGYLTVDEQGFVDFGKPIEIFIIGLLFKNEVINYWRCDLQLRTTIDAMLDAGLLESGSTLLSKEELSYYNYFLNQKQFTNGFDIRNKYLHGTNDHNAGQQQTDYYLLMILVVLTLIKIEDDIVCGILSQQSS